MKGGGGGGLCVKFSVCFSAIWVHFFAKFCALFCSMSTVLSCFLAYMPISEHTIRLYSYYERTKVNCRPS